MTTSFRDKIQSIFEKSESSQASHANGIKDLKEGFASNGKFKKYFTYILKRVLASQKLDEGSERLIKFIIKFLVDREYVISKHEESSRSFALYILNYLLDLTEASCKYVRWRSCRLIRGLLESLPPNELDESVIDCVSPQIIERIEDKSNLVRKEAATILLWILNFNLESNFEIQQCLVDAMKYDPCPNVRMVILDRIIINEDTIASIIERGHDIEKEIRNKSFRTIANKVSLSEISPRDRGKLIRNGVSDIKLCLDDSTNSYFPVLLDKYQQDIEGGMIGFLNFFDLEEYEQDLEKVLHSFFRQKRIELVKFNEGSLNRTDSFFWRVFCEHTKKNLRYSVAEDILEEVLPTPFCDLIETAFDTSDPFVIQQVLKIALLIDHDEVGRRRLLGFLVNQLTMCKNVDNCLLMMRILRSLHYDEVNFLPLILECISELIDPLDGEADDDRALIALSLTEKILQETHFKTSNLYIKTLEESIICPYIQHRNPDVRYLAVRCLGLYCSLCIDSTNRYLELLTKISSLDNLPVRQIALQTLFDLILIYGMNALSSELYVQNSQTASIEETNLIQHLSESLGDEDPSIRSVSFEGFCKLFYNNHVNDLEIMKKLCFEIFNPATRKEKYKHIKSMLCKFFPIYCAMPFNRSLIENAYIEMLDFVISSKLSKTLLKDISAYFVDIFDDSKYKKSTLETRTIYNRIGHALLVHIVKNPLGDHGVYFPELFTFPWSDFNGYEEWKATYDLLKDAIQCVKNRQSVSHLKKALENLEKRKPQAGAQLHNSIPEESVDLTVQPEAPKEAIELEVDLASYNKKKRLKKRKPESSADIVPDVRPASSKRLKESETKTIRDMKKLELKKQLSKLRNLMGDQTNPEINQILESVKNQIDDIASTQEEEQKKSKKRKTKTKKVTKPQREDVVVISESTAKFITGPKPPNKKSKRVKSDQEDEDDVSFISTSRPHTRSSIKDKSALESSEIVINSDLEPPVSKRTLRSKKVEKQSSIGTDQMIVIFSGFSASEKVYNIKLRDKLCTILDKLKVKYLIDKTTKKATHIVSPPHDTTMRVYIASICGQWIMDHKWILESSKNGTMVHEEEYGTIMKDNPIKGKSIYITENFKTCNKDRFKLEQFKLLIEKAGKGKILDAPRGSPDFVLIGVNDDVQLYPSATCLGWNQFFSLLKAS